MAKVPEKSLQHAAEPHSCNQCHYSSTRAADLKRHKRKHSREKPFKCNQCNYSCRSAADLKKHMRKHSGERPFKCNQCSYSCTEAGDLKTHTQDTRHTSALTLENNPTSAINAVTQAKHLVIFRATWQGSTESNQMFKKKQQEHIVCSSSVPTKKTRAGT